MPDVSAERVARNNATFRESNERIAAAAEKYGLRDVLPFICECVDASCTTIIRLTPAAYEKVRSNPRHFVTVPGHEQDADQFIRVVEETPGYVVVEKVGEAGEIATALDPRGGHG